MKTSLLAFFFCAVLSVMAARADYTGVVFSIKELPTGTAINLDGEFPDQKMVVWIPTENVSVVGALPPAGTKVTARGKVTQHKDRDQIVVRRKADLVWSKD